MTSNSCGSDSDSEIHRCFHSPEAQREPRALAQVSPGARTTTTAHEERAALAAALRPAQLPEAAQARSQALTPSVALSRLASP